MLLATFAYVRCCLLPASAAPWPLWNHYLKSNKQRLCSLSVALLRRLDVATLAAAEALVERRVSVWWPEEAAWFAGTVVAYDAASGQHTVRLASLLE